VVVKVLLDNGPVTLGQPLVLIKLAASSTLAKVELTTAQAGARKLLTYVGRGNAGINVPQLEVIKVIELIKAKVLTPADTVREIFKRLCKDDDPELPCLLTQRTQDGVG
jgi:hypothetical protein